MARIEEKTFNRIMAELGAAIKKEIPYENDTILVPRNRRLDALIRIEKARKEGIHALRVTGNLEFAERRFRVLVSELDLREALETLYENDPVGLIDSKSRMVEIPISLLQGADIKHEAVDYLI